MESLVPDAQRKQSDWRSILLVKVVLRLSDPSQTSHNPPRRKGGGRPCCWKLQRGRRQKQEPQTLWSIAGAAGLCLLLEEVWWSLKLQQRRILSALTVSLHQTFSYNKIITSSRLKRTEGLMSADFRPRTGFIMFHGGGQCKHGDASPPDISCLWFCW